MAGKKHYQKSRVVDGVMPVSLSSWKWFGDFVQKELLDFRQYVFRGQASGNWKLKSTLDRLLETRRVVERPTLRAAHLRGFQEAVRGRRGPHPRILTDDNDWWALGQHHGLASPLLDWTESPYVALYFAFHELDTDAADTRVVWALAAASVAQKSRELLEGSRLGIEPVGPEPAVVTIVRPMSDENARLVSQRGLFVRGPDGTALEDWVRTNFAGSRLGILLKIEIPNKDRTVCLRALNRMNINHLSLFPDLMGASVYCNTDLRIKDY